METSETTLDEGRRLRVKAQIDGWGVESTAKRLGVARGTLLGAVAGANLQRATAAQLRQKIDALDDEPKPTTPIRLLVAIRCWFDELRVSEAERAKIAAMFLRETGENLNHVRIRAVAAEHPAALPVPKSIRDKMK